MLELSLLALGGTKMNDKQTLASRSLLFSGGVKIQTYQQLKVESNECNERCKMLSEFGVGREISGSELTTNSQFTGPNRYLNKYNTM